MKMCFHTCKAVYLSGDNTKIVILMRHLNYTLLNTKRKHLYTLKQRNKYSQCTFRIFVPGDNRNAYRERKILSVIIY